MNELTIDVDAAEAGLDAERLKRVDAHFAGYVADGRLPGWLLTVRRHGRLAHVARCGSRDLEAGLPVTDDTVWRIYSMTKPVTSVAAMMLYEEGRLALTDPVSAFIPAFNDVRVYAGGSDLKQLTVPAAEPVQSLAPAHAHRRAHLRLPPGAPGRRPVPGGGLRVGHAARHRPGPGLRPVGRLPAAVPAGHRVELLGGHRRPRPGRGGGLRPAPRRVLRRPDLRPARHDRHRVLGPPGGPAAAGRPLHPREGRPGDQARRLRPGSAQGTAHAQRGRRPGVHGGRLRPVHPDAAAPARTARPASSTASGC